MHKIVHKFFVVHEEGEYKMKDLSLPSDWLFVVEDNKNSIGEIIIIDVQSMQQNPQQNK